jgi:hypothetical protein
VRSSTSHSIFPRCTVGSGDLELGEGRRLDRGAKRREVDPCRRCAAAGARTSRAWNDGETGVKTISGAVTSTARATPPSAAGAGARRPLSGPTMSMPSFDSTAMSRSRPTLDPFVPVAEVREEDDRAAGQ